MEQMRKVPAIRFKEFKDEWKEEGLEDSNTLFTDGNYGESYPSVLDFTDKANGVPFLKGNNLKFGKINLENVNYITKKKHKELTSGHLLEDDIVLAVRGSLGALGYVEPKNEGWNINSQLAILRTDKSQLLGRFLLQFLLSNKGQKEILSRNSGSALKQLPINQLRTIITPKASLSEQEQIGDYFIAWDKLIALQEQKYEKLKQLKIAMLDKMFPKVGVNVPEIRFKGHHEGWSEQKMNQIFDFDIPTNTLSRALLNSNAGTIKNIHYGDILIKYNTILDVERESIPYINNAEPLDYKNHFLKDGDLVFADAAEDSIVGKAVEVTNVGGRFIVAGLHTIVARPLVSFSKLYLGYFINSNLYQNQLNGFMQGVKVLSISKTSLKKTNIWFPKELSEQRKIGAYFEELDKSIEGTQQQIEKFKHIKQALLSKMFV